MQLVMWWSGLRGAISFALAITLDETRWTYAPTSERLLAPLLFFPVLCCCARALALPSLAPQQGAAYLRCGARLLIGLPLRAQL
jgi:NhaP-type Na+/H+ or K+/H+ antiporter